MFRSLSKEKLDGKTVYVNLIEKNNTMYLFERKRNFSQFIPHIELFPDFHTIESQTECFLPGVIVTLASILRKLNPIKALIFPNNSLGRVSAMTNLEVLFYSHNTSVVLLFSTHIYSLDSFCWQDKKNSLMVAKNIFRDALTIYA